MNRKLTAAVLAVMAAGAVLTSCGGKEIAGTSVTVTEQSAVSAGTAEPEPVSSDDTSSEEEVVETGGDYAKEYTEKLAGGVYAIEATSKTAMFGEMPVSVKVNGDDLYVKMNTMGIDVEVCQKDGKAYNLMPQMKTYVISNATTAEQQGVNTYSLPEGSKFIGNEAEGGFVIEKYEIPTVINKTDVSIDLPLETQSYECKYYFTKDKQLKKIFVNSPATGETTFEINSISFEDVNIELPDLTDWTELKQGEKLDKVSTIKMGLSVYGVTEEMVTAAGYTYEQLAEMDEEKVTEVLTKIAEDNGLSFDPNA